MSMFGNKKNEISVKLADYTLTLFSSSAENPKIVYLNLGEYLASEFFIREKSGKFVLIVKCEEEKVEKEIYSFENKKEAVAAIQAVAQAMLSSKGMSKSKGKFRSFLKWITALVVVGGILFISFGTFLNMTNGGKVAGPEKVEAPKQGLQQEFLPEGKAVPLEDVVK